MHEIFYKKKHRKFIYKNKENLLFLIRNTEKRGKKERGKERGEREKEMREMSGKWGRVACYTSLLKLGYGYLVFFKKKC
jgi:hypothetical protein